MNRILIYPLLLLGFLPLTAMSTLAPAPVPTFLAAKPVWVKGREKEKNLSVGFRAIFEAPAQGRTLLRATGSSTYRVFLNGQFLAHGPARGPHGFYRVDEWDLTSSLRPGTNVVAFEVAGYNVNSYYLLDQPAFLQAEVATDTKVLASTGTEAPGFAARLLPERVQKVQRYSFQRPFTEIYELNPASPRWRTSLHAGEATAELALQPHKELLHRSVPYPEYHLRQPQKVVSHGSFSVGNPVENLWKDRSLTGVGPTFGGYPEHELKSIPSIEIQGHRTTNNAALNTRYNRDEQPHIAAGNFRIFDFGVNLTGFIGATLACDSNTRLLLVFDEMLKDGDIDYKRMNCVNLVEYRLEPGHYSLETFEPYTLRYLKVAVLEGSCDLQSLYLREFASPGVNVAQFSSSDERLNRLFRAGVETFRQNTLDAFMDCPSRERAGWLCDSFFTARVAKDLWGDTRFERTFLENYLLPKKFEYLPEGMLPMCYPADHNDGVFIPNWALWFVVQLQEYLQRSGDEALVNAFRPRVSKLFEYFRKYQNSDGLLEKLDGWVFVEWSAANSFVQDVNYPSNMLFAQALLTAGALYDIPAWVQEGNQIKETIRRQAFDGKFFVDNAVRQEGKLTVTTNRTEVCQYFAFFFDVATPESHAELWNTLVRDFGPHRKERKLHPEVHNANAFVGTVLRLELLSRQGLSRQLLDESVAYQMYMVERTGTLWENASDDASCNHGFASHGGVHVLFRDVLGLREVDTLRKTVRVTFTDPGVEWCQGQVPTPEGPVSVYWRNNDGKIAYDIHAPAGYQLDLENFPE